MIAARLRDNEAASLAALYELGVLDSVPDAEIDALARVAAEVCGVPIALVGLIDTDRQWFKANIGLEGVAQTSREASFCAHAVLGDELFVVPDARHDERFADNPLVVGEPFIRFYAGAPVSVKGGDPIGTVCVIDREPRRLSESQRSTLRHLAVAVGKALEGRAASKKLRQHVESVAEREHALRLVIDLQGRTARALNHAQRLGGIGSWEWDVVDDEWTWSDEMFRIAGRSRHLPPPTSEERLTFLVPESREPLRRASAECRADGVAYVLELELLPIDGERRWAETRGEAVRDADGRIVALQGTVQDVTERKRLTRELARHHEVARLALQQLRHVTNSLPALICDLDRDERVRFANQTCAAWFGRDPVELVGTRLVDLYGSAADDGFKDPMARALGGERVSCALELETLQGRRHVEASVIPDLDEQGGVDGLFVMMIDATARRDAEAALQRSERRLRMVADNIPALVTYLDAEERYRFVNDFHGSVFHVEPALLLGRTMREVVGARLYGEIAPHVAAALRGEQAIFQGVLSIKEKRYHYQSTYVPDTDDAGVVRGFYAMTFDISALKETQRQLDALARVDSLTGLPNRRHFDERLPEAMARSRRSGVPMSLLFLDIDRFKHINDTLGHGTGDGVLQEFAARLKREVRGTDLVARLAGDEFVIVLEGVHETAGVRNVAEKIVRSIRPPLDLGDGHTLELTTSMGVAVYAGGPEAAADLLAAADRALYQAKRAGRDGFALASADDTPVSAALVADDPAPRPVGSPQ